MADEKTSSTKFAIHPSLSVVFSVAIIDVHAFLSTLFFQPLLWNFSYLRLDKRLISVSLAFHIIYPLHSHRITTALTFGWLLSIQSSAKAVLERLRNSTKPIRWIRNPNTCPHNNTEGIPWWLSSITAKIVATSARKIKTMFR